MDNNSSLSAQPSEAEPTTTPHLTTENPKPKQVDIGLTSNSGLLTCSQKDTAFSLLLIRYRLASGLPGHKHSGIHRRRIILPSWYLVIAKVPRTPILLILPVTEAFQGPLTMVPYG